MAKAKKSKVKEVKPEQLQPTDENNLKRVMAFGLASAYELGVSQGVVIADQKDSKINKIADISELPKIQ
jgi:hypothetical protein